MDLPPPYVARGLNFRKVKLKDPRQRYNRSLEDVGETYTVYLLRNTSPP